jgi:uncharacterized membrane protein
MVSLQSVVDDSIVNFFGRIFIVFAIVIIFSFLVKIVFLYASTPLSRSSGKCLSSSSEAVMLLPERLVSKVLLKLAKP